MQVGEQIGLDDIERLQERRTSFREGKHAPVIRGGGFGVGFGLVWVVSLRSWAGARETGLHSPEVAPKEAV